MGKVTSRIGQRFSFRDEDKAAEFLLAIIDICDWTLDLPALAKQYNSDLVRYEVYQVYLRMSGGYVPQGAE
jgi:hypothetical protein